jgi:Zn-finger nucleic acid-binding protein
MRQAERMGVEIDFCPSCRGIWLDGGELEKLMERSQGYDFVHTPQHNPQGEFLPQETYRDEHKRQPAHQPPPPKSPRKRKGFFAELRDLFD